MSTLFRPEVLATMILAVSLMFIGSPQVQPVNATAAFAAQSNVFANAAYVFVEPTGGWGGLLTENQKLSAAPGAAASPIDVLALSSDTLVMGAPNEDLGRFRR